MALLSPAVVAAATWFAMLLDLEGGKGYIILAWVFYVARNCPRWQKAMIYIPAVLLSRWRLVLWVAESLGTAEFSGALRNCLLNVLGNYFGMLADNGEKGRAGKGFQYFCYAFYPAHFALLALIGFLRPPLT